MSVQPSTTRLVLVHHDQEQDFGLIAVGPLGTSQTVAVLLAAIQHAKGDRLVLDVARVLKTPERVYDAVKGIVKFARDPEGVELVRTPPTILADVARTGSAYQADCDDGATLTAALLRAIGKVPVLIVAARSNDPSRFVHIFAGYLRDPRGPVTRENVIPMDPQERLPIGVWPTGTIERVTLATEEHA